MRSYLLILTTLLFYQFHANAQFTEDFEDGEIQSNPNWVGEITKFEVQNGMLRLVAPAEKSEAHLLTASQLSENLEAMGDLMFGFNPSSSNFLEIFICSDMDKKPSNGLFLRFGDSQDHVALYYRSQGNDELILASHDDFLDVDSVSIRFHLLQEEDSIHLYLDSTITGNFQHKFSAPFEHALQSSFYLLRCKYSSTRSQKFYLDNLYLNGNTEQNPPSIISAESLGLNSVLLSFNEPLDSIVALSATCSIEGQKASKIEYYGDSLLCTWSTDFENGSDKELFVQGLRDLVGNEMLDTMLLLRFAFGYPPSSSDIIVSEIMADPSPAIFYPEYEWIELYNRSEKPIDLKGCRLLNRTIDQKCIVLPNSFLFVSSDKAQSSFSIEKALYLEGLSNYFLANESGQVELYNANDDLVLSQEYQKEWHHLSEAKEGGYSLSIRALDKSCNNSPQLWASSLDNNGASPGMPNNTIALEPEQKVEIAWIRERLDGVELEFSQPLDTSQISLLADENPIAFRLRSPDRLFIPSINPDIEYLFDIDVLGCISKEHHSIDLMYKTAKEASRHLVINEILYDPHPGSGEYIEVLNCGEEYLRLKNLFFTISSNTSEYLLDSSGLVLAPGQFLLVSNDSSNYPFHYPEFNASAYYPFAKKPSLSNEGASLRLHHPEFGVIDEVSYHDELHFGAIINSQGVSLERIRPKTSGLEKSNWTSAASSVNYGTPGNRNSQWWSQSRQDDFVVEPKFISPDNDGQEDICRISIKASKANQLIRLNIFDKSGNKVLEISDKEVAATENTYTWNGENEYGMPVPQGIYLILCEIENGSSSKVFKESITVLYK